MNLDELKNRISKLDDTLDKTNKDVKIDISKAKPAQTKLLYKFRTSFIACFIFAVIYTLMVIGGVTPRKFPEALNIGLIVYVLFAGILYACLFFCLRNTNVATIKPAKLYKRTAHLRLLMMAGETILFLGIFLLIPLIKSDNDDWIFYVMVSMAVVTFINFKKNWPECRQLFNELNSTK